MLVYQFYVFSILYNYAEAIKAANKPLERIARQEQSFDLNSCFSDLIEKLILNIKMSLRHFRTPVQ